MIIDPIANIEQIPTISEAIDDSSFNPFAQTDAAPPLPNKPRSNDDENDECAVETTSAPLISFNDVTSTPSTLNSANDHVDGRENTQLLNLDLL